MNILITHLQNLDENLDKVVLPASCMSTVSLNPLLAHYNLELTETRLKSTCSLSRPST